MGGIEFIVIDNKTGKEADAYQIALREDWAKNLIYCDIEGFAILEEGNLVLLDECGGVVYCPNDRFTIRYIDKLIPIKEIIDKVDDMIGGKMIAQALREIYLGEE